METKNLQTVIWCKYCGMVAQGTLEQAVWHKEGKCIGSINQLNLSRRKKWLKKK